MSALRIFQLPWRPRRKKIRGHYSFCGHGQSDSAHAQLLSEEFLDWSCLIGPPEACVDKLQKLFAQGLEYVYLAIGPLGVSDEEKRDVLKTLAERVVPHFK